MKYPDGIPQEIINYIKEYKELYAPLPHSFFKGLGSTNKDRSKLILEHLSQYDDISTVADLGSHYGANCYLLSEHYKVTAYENHNTIYPALVWLRDNYGASFECVKANILECKDLNYDVIIATALFHHFCKTQSTFEQFIQFLTTIQFKYMFFEAHNPKESQMDNAYYNVSSNVMAELIKSYTGKKNADLIYEGIRNIYKIY